MAAFFDNVKAIAEELEQMIPIYFGGEYSELGTLPLNAIERVVADFMRETNRQDIPDRAKLSLLEWILKSARLNKHREGQLIVDETTLSDTRNPKKVSIKSTSVEYDKSAKELAKVQQGASYDTLDSELQKDWNELVCSTRKLKW